MLYTYYVDTGKHGESRVLERILKSPDIFPRFSSCFKSSSTCGQDYAILDSRQRGCVVNVILDAKNLLRGNCFYPENLQLLLRVEFYCCHTWFRLYGLVDLYRVLRKEQLGLFYETSVECE